MLRKRKRHRPRRLKRQVAGRGEHGDHAPFLVFAKCCSVLAFVNKAGVEGL
jgi:hypothetical protein